MPTFLSGECSFTEGNGWLYVDAEYCRAKARELREQARTAHDTSACAHLLVMARQYDWLAEWIEAEKREREKP
jgi:hypothetical protein